MRRFILTVSIVLVALLVLAGCAGVGAGVQQPQQEVEASQAPQEEQAEMGGDEKPTEEDVRRMVIGPYSLINREEAQALLGEPVKGGETYSMESIGQYTVLYKAEDDALGAMLQVSIIQQSDIPKGSTITPEETYEGAKAGLEGTSGAQIDGIGDDCFTGTPGLHILCDGYYITIAAGNTDDPEVVEVLKKAGETAVENLQKMLDGHL